MSNIRIGYMELSGRMYLRVDTSDLEFDVLPLNEHREVAFLVLDDADWLYVANRLQDKLKREYKNA